MDRISDIHFHCDPVCPFAWLTSKWVRSVARQRDYQVDWRFISLRLINEHVDYGAHFPAGYEQGHTAGLRMLRVCAAARERHGREVVGDLYAALGASVFDIDRPADPDAHQASLGTRGAVAPLLLEVGLDEDLADEIGRASGRERGGQYV